MTGATRTIRTVREGGYLAEVAVTLTDDGHPWAPFVSAADVAKLDAVRLALRRGDLQAAKALATVYELKPVPAS